MGCQGVSRVQARRRPGAHMKTPLAESRSTMNTSLLTAPNLRMGIGHRTRAVFDADGAKAELGGIGFVRSAADYAVSVDIEPGVVVEDNVSALLA